MLELPNSTSTPERILFPSSRLLNSNEPLEKSLFLKITCTPWELLSVGQQVNNFTNDPNNIYAGMDPLICSIFIPAPKQIQSLTNIRYIDDANAVQGSINTASQVGGAITDIALALLPPPFNLIGVASAIIGAARTIETGRRDLDSTDMMFESAEKRSYNISFTLTATTEQEGRDIAKIANMFHALALPQKSTTFSFNAGAPIADKAYPPPLWRFGIGTGVGSNIDPSWLGQTSFTVLKSVNINTAAAGSPYMIKTTRPSASVKPLMTSFVLNFIDYEPVYRSDDSYQVIPRSATII